MQSKPGARPKISREYCRPTLGGRMAVEKGEDMHWCRRLLGKALSDLLEHYNVPLESLVSLEIDFYGPRVIVGLKPEWADALYLDVSPDGVEATVTLRLAENLDRETVEAAAAEFIESDESFSHVADYDVVYDSETGELSLTLHTDTLSAQPTPSAIGRLVRSLAQAGNR